MQIRKNSSKLVQRHDKSIKDILSNKTEMSMFLKQFIGLEIYTYNLEEQKNNFLTEDFVRKESDIVYKMKNNEIYFLVEHQSTVDKLMAERILKYTMLIIENVRKNNKLKEIPLIIPIVLYTGKNRWNSARNFSKLQVSQKEYKEYKIKLRYKLIDINKYTEDDLIKKNTKLANMMLIEKCNKTTDLIKMILKLRLSTEDEERISWLKRIVRFMLPNVIGTERESLLKILDKKEKSEMEELKDRLEKYERNLKVKERKKGKREGLMAVIKNMLKLNQDEKTIMKFTNAKKEDIQKVKKQLGIQIN